MIRKLFIVFGSGLLLSALLLSAAWVVGGNDLVNHIGNNDHGRGPQATRTMAFDGSKILAIDGPINLRFTRGDKSEMIVRGPADVVNRVRYENGKLIVTDKKIWMGDGLDITITAPMLAGLELAGASDVELTGLDQAELRIVAAGAVDVEASGKVRKVIVAGSGAGDIDLEKVEAEDATVDLAGVGSADISATGSVKATIAGAGNITLHRRPTNLQTDISGVGSIDHDYPGGE